MLLTRRELLWKGIRDGMPIFFGYLAVSFTLGITAVKSGLTTAQAGLLSFTMNASAGEYAALTVMAADEGLIAALLMTLVANARYLLMSCALSQKLPENTSMLHRMLIGYDITDEIFGACMNFEGALAPFYAYGLFAVALPGWTVGTLLGAMLGAVLPANIMSALSVGLYGMFIAIIVPPARGSRILAVLILIAMGSSFLVAQLLPVISSGIRILLLTVVIASAAAYFFPLKEENADA